MSKEVENSTFIGRPKGSLNKRNIEIFELAQELNCNPAKILMLIALGNSQELNGEIIDIDKRMAAAKELMPYLYGKRKPVDSNGDDANDPITAFIEALSGSK